jgi:hypothetical protein
LRKYQEDGTVEFADYNEGRTIDFTLRRSPPKRKREAEDADVDAHVKRVKEEFSDRAGFMCDFHLAM